MMGTGEFEICEGGALSVSGFITVPSELPTDPKQLEHTETVYELNSADIYKELRLRGYDYGPDFRGILRTDITGL